MPISTHTTLFLNSGHVTVLPSSMHIYLLDRVSCWLFNTCCDQFLVVPTARKDGVFLLIHKSGTVWGACILSMSLHRGQKSSKSLHSNRWKTVLVLSSLKTYNIFWTTTTLFSRLISCQLVTFDLSERQGSLASQTLFIFTAAPIIILIRHPQRVHRLRVLLTHKLRFLWWLLRFLKNNLCTQLPFVIL